MASFTMQVYYVPNRVSKLRIFIMYPPLPPMSLKIWLMVRHPSWSLTDCVYRGKWSCPWNAEYAKAHLSLLFTFLCLKVFIIKDKTTFTIMPIIKWNVYIYICVCTIIYKWKLFTCTKYMIYTTLLWGLRTLYFKQIILNGKVFQMYLDLGQKTVFYVMDISLSPATFLLMLSICCLLIQT